MVIWGAGAVYADAALCVGIRGRPRPRRSSTGRRVLKLAAVALAGSLALWRAAAATTRAAPRRVGGTAAASDVKVGLAYDIGGRGDKSFNDSAAAGLDRAQDELGVEVEELEATSGETDAQKEERLRLLADGGYNLP